MICDIWYIYMITSQTHKNTHTYILHVYILLNYPCVKTSNITGKLLLGRWRDAPLKVTMAGRPLALVMLRPRSATWVANKFWWGTLRNTWGCVNDFVRIYIIFICCYMLTMSYYCRYDHFGVPPYHFCDARSKNHQQDHIFKYGIPMNLYILLVLGGGASQHIASLFIIIVVIIVIVVIITAIACAIIIDSWFITLVLGNLMTKWWCFHCSSGYSDNWMFFGAYEWRQPWPHELQPTSFFQGQVLKNQILCIINLVEYVLYTYTRCWFQTCL